MWISSSVSKVGAVGRRPAMDTLFSTFLLFLAAIVALLTYLIVPFVPVVTLAAAAAVALAAGVWWHWTQFATDYRLSTWQEQLRSYASYALLLVVILLSYAFYAFAYSGGTLEQLASRSTSAIRNAGRRATNAVSTSLSAAATAASNAGSVAFSSVSEEEQPAAGAPGFNLFAPAAAPVPNRRNTNRNANFLM